MPKPNIEDLYSWELHFETAASAILKAGGVPVVSPFVPPDGRVSPVEQQILKEKHAVVRFEPAPIDPAVKAFATGVPGITDGIDSLEVGWSGDLIVDHVVPVDDQPPEPGMPNGCYAESLRQAGRIRAILLAPAHPFSDLLPFYDILSVRFVQPQRGVDEPRGANTATERFRITFMPATGTL